MAKESILVVDDDDRIRKLLTSFLERRGYEVVQARDGLEALRIASEEPPNLVITDVNMPNINGLELTRRLRSFRKTARTPIIMLSAQRQTDEILAGYAEGVDEYVAKPVEVAVLGAKVDTLLRRSRTSADSTLSRGGEIIAFFHAKGGVGTTTLAVNTAVTLAALNPGSTTVLDLSLEFGNLAMLLDVMPQRYLAELAEVPVSELEEDAFTPFVVQHASGLQVMVGARGPEQAELVTLASVQQTLGRLRTDNEYVLVDTAPSFSELNLSVLDLADAVCVVTSPNLPSLKATADALQVLERLDIPSERIRIVLNRTSPGGVDTDQAGRFLRRHLAGVIPYTPLLDEAADTGRPFAITHMAHSTSIAMREFATSMERVRG